jgi:hypothetical protein
MGHPCQSLLKNARPMKTILGLAIAGLLPSAAAAQTPTPTSLIAAGDTIIGMGSMENATYVGVTDSNLWSALVDTSFDDGSKDGCVLRNGFVMLREGTQLFAPPSSRLGEWISINMNSKGDLGQVLLLEVPGGTQQGLFWNLVPIALKGTPVVHPNVGAGTTWDNFAVVKLTDRNKIFVLGEVADPTITGAREDALVTYQVDDLGNVTGSEVLAAKGSFVDALSSIVDTLGASEHILGVNDEGDFITFVSALGAKAVLVNLETIVAQEGQPSSVGTPWATLALTKVAINNRGDYIVTGALNGQVYLIEKNGQKFAQAGDVIPSLSAASLANGTLAPLYLAGNGDVIWQARFNGANDDCFARNYEPFIKRNQTLIGGQLVTAVIGDENSFGISKEGRFFAGRVQVQPTRNMVAFVDFGLVLEDPGCGTNVATLKHDSGRALVGGQFKLALDDGQVTGALPLLIFATQRATAPCGIPTQYGEFLLSPPHIATTLFQTPWNGTTPAIFTINVPNTISLVDAVFFAQGAFRDPAQPSPEKFRFSNAVRIELGPP